MTDYPNLAALRAGLTADDPDDRAESYSSVLEADVQPSDVLESDPADETVQALVDAEVIPEGTTAERRPGSEREEEKLEVLKDIRDALEGGGS